MFNALMLNRGQLNGPRSSTATSTGAHATKAYRLEVHSADGAIVGLPLGWRNGRAKFAVNEFGTLAFEMPYTAANWSLFDYNQNSTRMFAQVWLYGATGNLLEKYHVWKRTKSDSAGTLTIKVECRSIFWQLAREPISNFESGNEQQTVTTGATGGQFKWRVKRQTTSAIAYNESTASVQSKLEALSTIGAGNVAVTGTPGAWAVEFIGDLAETDVAQIIIADNELTGPNKRVVVSTSRQVRNVREIVNYLLNKHQTQRYPIYLSSIDWSIGEITHSVKFQNTNIMAALLQLRETFGGYMYVEPETRRLHWKRRIGVDTGQYVRMRKNGTNLDVSEDFSEIITQVIATGRGMSAQTKLESTVSGNQSTYGTVRDIVANQQIWNQDELDDFATALLNARKQPRKSFSVGAIDLSALNPADYSFFGLQVGSKVDLISDELGETLESTIGTIELNIDEPGQITLTFTDPASGTTEWGANEPNFGGSRPQDAADIIAELASKLDEFDRGSAFSSDLGEHLPEVLEGAVEGDPIYDALADVVQDVLEGQLPGPSGDIPQPVATTGVVGSELAYSRADHVHPQQAHVVLKYIVDTFTDLSVFSPTEGQNAYVKDTGREYVRRSSSWECTNALE